MRVIMTTRAITPRCFGATFAIAVLGLALTACGGDDAPAAAKPPAKAAPAKSAAAKKGGKLAATVQVYTKVEEVVTEEERKTIRRPFVDKDFAPDSSGNENRDPFRSYVVRQVGTGPQAQQQPKEEGDDNCSAEQMKAPRYNIRALVLIGIVLRGAKSYGLFRDTAGVGWIVKRNDCLGKEKARVTKIDAEFVALEVVPDAGLNQAQRPPVEQTIKLHQKDLEIPVDMAEGSEEAPSEGNKVPPAQPAAPSTPTAQPTPVAPPPTGAGGG